MYNEDILFNERTSMSKIDQRDRLKENPFDYQITKQGKTRLFFEGREIMMLGNKDTEKLKKRIEGKNDFDKQLILAKVTGHFKH